MKRRTVWGSAFAVAAGVAGVGGALWRSRSGDPAPAVDIWPMEFETPQGSRLEFAKLRGKPLLLNFWATWCPPCVRELPLLDRFYRDQQAHHWQVAGLAVDNLAPVLEFLGKQPVSFPVGLTGAGGVELARALGNAGGALPYTVVFDRAGKVARRKLGVLEPEDLANWVASIT